MLAIAILFCVAIAGIIFGSYAYKRERQTRVAGLIHELEGQAQAVAPPTGTQAMNLVQRFAPQGVLESYSEKLRFAGGPYGLDGLQFFGLKLVAAVALPAAIPVLALFQLGSWTMPVMALAAVIGFMGPDVWLNGKVGARQREAQEELPLFTDLIATAVSAGLPLTEAVRRVAADVPGLVAREFLRTVQEMAAGKQRMQAWRDLMDRVPGDEFRTIVTAIMQAEQYGTSVAEILRYQVQQIRTLKQQDAQRIAQATTVRMRVPMLVLILLPFMVLLLSPALLRIAQLLN